MSDFSQREGCQLYLDPLILSRVEHVSTKLQAVSEYLSRQKFNMDELFARASFPVDFSSLISDTFLLNQWPDVATSARDEPDVLIGLLGLAMYSRLLQDSDENDDDGIPPDIPKVVARIHGYRPATPLADIKSCLFGRLVCVKGTVVRMSGVKPHCIAMSFQCQRCQAVFRHRLTAGVLEPPRSCRSCGHSGKGLQLRPLRSYRLTETVDRQTLRLQEKVEDSGEEGRVPRAMEVELLAGLVDCCVPGDVVVVCGVVRAHTQPGSDSALQQLFVSASSVQSVRTGATKGTSGVSFSRKDYYAIQALQSRSDVFRLLVSSLCPAIYGHLLVKAGLLLAMLGGTTVPHRRGHCHVLLLGDPGLGKSQLLQACASVAPRAVYVCGPSSSGAGLTVAVSGGRQSCDSHLEAGALVLADQGVCCIDEFDKLGSQSVPLLEAMEQQMVSVAKAGVVCSLPARTAVLAAANPSGGHYDRTRPLLENVRLGAALLSRFDLLYVLVDRPDSAMDSLVSSHIMAQQACSLSRSSSAPGGHNTSRETANSSAVGHPDWDCRQPLAERLQLPPCDGNTMAPLPHSLLRKYIAYARRYVQPRLSPEACHVLREFYLRMRSASRLAAAVDSVPVTMRMLESLVRLTQARARLELSETASTQHARDVVELMQFAVESVGGATGAESVGRSVLCRSGRGKGGRLRKFVTVLTRCAERLDKTVFSEQELKQLMVGIGADFRQCLDTANHEGLLIKKADGLYQLSL